MDSFHLLFCLFLVLPVCPGQIVGRTSLYFQWGRLEFQAGEKHKGKRSVAISGIQAGGQNVDRMLRDLRYKTGAVSDPGCEGEERRELKHFSRHWRKGRFRGVFSSKPVG